MEREFDSSSMEEQRNIPQMPTKMEMVEMFAKLEDSIKSEISNVRTDMGFLLRGVEEVEEKSENQAQEISELKMQIRKLQSDHRDILYKLEDQENQNRHQNLRIRAIPERTGKI